MRILHATALLALAVGLAGCGGGSTGASSATGTQAADLVSSVAVALVSINTDRDGDQWQQADDLLSRFPGREQLIVQLRSELTKQGLDWEGDVEPALGPEVDVAVGYQAGQGDPDVVALTKPDDAGKLKALAAKSKGRDPILVRELEDGWWAISDKEQSITRLVAAKDAPTLAEQPDFQTASEDQTGESLVEAYVNVPRLRSTVLAQFKQVSRVPFLDKLMSVVGSVEAVDDGVRLHGSARGVDEKVAPAFDSRFVDEVPAGVLLFATFRGSGLGLGQLGSIGGVAGQFEQQLGIKLEDVQQLLSGEIALYVRPAALIPEVTLVATTDDEARAKRTLDTLAKKVSALVGAPLRTTDAGGLTYTQIPVQGLNVSYAVGNGRIIVTDLPSGAAKLGEGDSLADDEDFKAAVEAAGMPAKTTGFAYVNVADALSILDALASDSVPADARENLRQLTTLLVFGSREGDKATVGGFLGIGE